MKRFEQEHGGQSPSPQDWLDYLFSLSHPGTGPNGTWTKADWDAYSQVRSILGNQLLSQIGQRGGIGTGLYGLLGQGIEAISTRGHPFLAQWIGGPDGTIIILTDILLPDDVYAMTLGNTIIIRPLRDNPALRAHEYVHVLQYRSLGTPFLKEYVDKGGFNNPDNLLERPAYDVQGIYESNSWLPPIWEFPYVR